MVRLFFIDNEDLGELSETVKQGFERIILDAIFNDGFLQNIHSSIVKMAKLKTRKFLDGFDSIFTLNYDDNIENLTGRPVFHLHGDYSVIADSENPATLCGNIRSTSEQLISIPDGYNHCFCNALLDYSGNLKLKRAENIDALETDLRKLNELFLINQSEFNKKVGNLKEKDRQLIDTYIQKPFLIAGTNYHFHEFKNLTGELYIIGMSPNNDSHIFKCINNSDLNKVFFYYREEKPGKTPNVTLTKPYKMLNVDDLWNSLNVNKPRYTCNYHIPAHPDLDKFISLFNDLSGDEISKKQMIDEVNSVPQFEIDRLCKLVTCELENQKLQGNPRSENALINNFHEISRIGLREGVFPSSLYMMFIMNHPGT